MLEQIFKELRKKFESIDSEQKLSNLWVLMHTLSKHKYAPALSFFENGLNHKDWLWRLQCLECIGFHYEFQPDGDISNKIRNLLLNDPNDDVRMTAASVLGIRSKYPDKSLIQALTKDSNSFVKEAAYEALLNLADIPNKAIIAEMALIKQDKVTPTLQRLKRTLPQS